MNFIREDSYNILPRIPLPVALIDKTYYNPRCQEQVAGVCFSCTEDSKFPFLGCGSDIPTSLDIFSTACGTQVPGCKVYDVDCKCSVCQTGYILF